MKILFVVNNFYATGNGLSASARRTVERLKAAGVDVRVLSGRDPDQPDLSPDFVLEDFTFPIFEKLIRSHGYKFAKTDRKVMREAVRWADVVHLEEPFHIQYHTLQIARKLGVPCTGTFHMHPENLFCSLHLGQWKLLNEGTMRLWRDFIFNKCTDVQCPTENVFQRLQQCHYRSRMHLISNGIVPDPSRRQPPTGDKKPYLLACISRLAVEKDQYTLIEAMRYCRHARDIQLFFAGRGPEAGKMKKAAHALVEEGILTLEPVFRFMDRDGLRDLAAKADLYIHCATVEVEGLSALEALQQEVVPIIAEGRLTATPQFALDSRSLFPERNPRALAERIDYWLDHPEERLKMGRAYAQSTEKYSATAMTERLIGMFRQAIGD